MLQFAVLTMPNPTPADPSPELRRLLEMGIRPGSRIHIAPGKSLDIVTSFEPGFIPTVMAAFDQLLLVAIDPPLSQEDPQARLLRASGLADPVPPAAG